MTPDKNPRYADALSIGATIGLFVVAEFARRPMVGVAALAVCIVLAARLRRYELWLIVVVFVALFLRSMHAEAGLSVAQSRLLEGEVVELASDPVWRTYSLNAIVELEGQRLLMRAHGEAARQIANREQGDQLLISGSLRGQPANNGWRRAQRIVGTISPSEVSPMAPARGPTGFANRFRALLERGASSLNGDHRSLYTGLVYGDDRGQSPQLADDFSASGLGHLLAVSGQNVVFVLLIGEPLLKRIRSDIVRFAATVVVLAGFGFVTRFEPSVSRALAMAGVVLLSNLFGRRSDAKVVLPGAVAVVLFLDPTMSSSLGLRLSVAATLGLTFLSRPLIQRIPGPSITANALGSTAAAQLGVSPLLIAEFGGVSVTSLLANMLAGPLAAGVMMWGLTGGVLAGLSPDAIATALHFPTRIALSSLEQIAKFTASIPVARFSTLSLLLCGIGYAFRRSRRSWLLPGGSALLVVGALLPVMVVPTLSAGVHTLDDGAVLNRSHAQVDVLVVRAGNAEVILEALRRARVGRIDLVIATEGSRAVSALIVAIESRFEVTDIWAPPLHEVRGAQTFPTDPVTLGDLWVAVDMSSTDDVNVVIEHEEHERAHLR